MMMGGADRSLRRSWDSREILRVLRVKPHVLRYWEESLPLIRSTRDESGRRTWNDAQVRLLLRLRHLVVERGMSVQGAGSALLSEAHGSTATAKARLEAVRQQLASLLLDLNRGVTPRDPDDTGTAPPPIEGTVGRVVPLSLEALIEQGLVPAPPWMTESAHDAAAPASGINSTAAHARAGVAARPAAARVLPSVVEPGSGVPRTLALVYVHLFAATAIDARDRLLARLLARRLQPEAHAIVAVWVDEVGAMRDALDAAGLPEDRVALLPIRPAAWRGRLQRTPTLSLLVALAEDPDLEQVLAAAQADGVYLWPLDVPQLPAAAPAPLAAAARRAVAGVALHGWRAARGRSTLSGGAVLELAVWRGRFAQVMRAGRWVPGSGVPLDEAVPPADTHHEGARYEVWLRDLTALGAPIVLAEGDPPPVPWRGSDWRMEVESLWDQYA